MKQKLKLIILIISIGFIGLTCKKTVDEIPPSLSINPPTKEVDANTGSFSINVTSTITWTANCDKSWINIDPSQGEGNGTIKANYQTNSSATNRTATITVKGTGVADQTIVVTQLGIQPVLTITPTNITVPAVASSQTINITSNLSWNAASNQTWCSLAQTSGIGNATLTINCQASTVQSQRTAIITFTANGVSNQTVQVTQAEFVPVLTINPTSQTVNSAQGMANYTITSNIAWSATTSDTWISIVNPSGVNNGTLSINYQPNTTSGNRTATIVVSGIGVSNQSITLTQTNIIPTLTIAPTNKDVTAIAGTTTFDITSNTGWTAQSDQTWCTITNTTGNGNATLSINYEQNTTNAQRIATISIIGNGLTAKTVTVTQQSAIPMQGLVAYYPFNGNANDESGTGNNGIVYGATLTSDRKGNSNKAYYFDGNSYIKVSNSQSLNFTNVLTICAWVKLNNPYNDQKILSKMYALLPNKGYTFGVSVNKFFPEYKDNNSLDVSCIGGSVAANSWAFLSVTIEIGGYMKSYINGIKVCETSVGNQNISTSNVDLIIGRANWDNVFQIVGSIDDIRIYNRSLSESEIQALYNE